MTVTYKIGEAAALLNLKTYVLRFWETEFPQITPLRTDKGQRLYTEDHLALLDRIRFLLHDRGLTIEGARKVLAEEAGRGIRYIRAGGEQKAEPVAEASLAPAGMPSSGHAGGEASSSLYMSSFAAAPAKSTNDIPATEILSPATPELAGNGTAVKHGPQAAAAPATEYARSSALPVMGGPGTTRNIPIPCAARPSQAGADVGFSRVGNVPALSGAFSEAAGGRISVAPSSEKQNSAGAEASNVFFPATGVEGESVAEPFPPRPLGSLPLLSGRPDPAVLPPSAVFRPYGEGPSGQAILSSSDDLPISEEEDIFDDVEAYHGSAGKNRAGQAKGASASRRIEVFVTAPAGEAKRRREAEREFLQSLTDELEAVATLLRDPFIRNAP